MPDATLPLEVNSIGPHAVSAGKPSNWLVNLAAIACGVFGLLLILQVQVAGDGMWFWYAKLFLGGRHLYGELHLALQPLYVLVTAANMRLFGEGWLVSKLPPTVLLAMEVLLLRAIVLRLPVLPGLRAVLMVAAFAFPLLFEAERFDDYHVMADCFQIGSILLLLGLRPLCGASAVLSRAALLGVLSGLAMMSRLNDGGLLWGAVLLAILALAPLRKGLSALLFTVATACTSVLVVGLTGDSLKAYAANSIVHAAGAKGGTGKLLLYPFRLVVESSSHFYRDTWYVPMLMGVAALAWIVSWISRQKVLHAPNARVHAGATVVVLTLMAYVPLLKVNRWPIILLPHVVCTAMILVGLGMGIMAIVHTVAPAMQLQHDEPRKPASWNPTEVLLFIPLGQLASGSLSSGGDSFTLNAPIGILLLLLPFAYPTFFRRPDRAYGYASAVFLASLCCLAYKAGTPFNWHSYQNAPLFTARQWYRHPRYGPMVIETDLLEFMEPLCARVHDVVNPSLLSLPFPYANYFCSVEPWHNEVQTFFDTSTAQHIHSMQAALQTGPPHTIVYQRQILNMLLHERLYTQYQPLPHRAIDALIMSKLDSGEWSLQNQQCVTFSDWLLIETVPRASQVPGHALPLNSKPYRCVDPKVGEEWENAAKAWNKAHANAGRSGTP